VPYQLLTRLTHVDSLVLLQISLFPFPVRRAIAEALKVFKHKEAEWGKMPSAVIHRIFSILCVGKSDGNGPSTLPRHTTGWLQPPEPAVELFTLLLLLDVLKAPDVQRTVENVDNTQVAGAFRVVGETKSADKLSIETFFNRMLALSTTWQRRIFQYFTDIHDREMADAEMGEAAVAGVTSLGSGDQRSYIDSEELICVETNSGSAVKRLTLKLESGDTRLGWKSAWQKLRECGEMAHDGGNGVIDAACRAAAIGAMSGPTVTDRGVRYGAVCGFYQQKRSKRTVLVVKEPLASTYAMWRPNSRKSAERRRMTYRQLCDRLARFVALTDATARSDWVSSPSDKLLDVLVTLCVRR
jgi:hypothetical protein